MFSTFFSSLGAEAAEGVPDSALAGVLISDCILQIIPKKFPIKLNLGSLYFCQSIKARGMNNMTSPFLSETIFLHKSFWAREFMLQLNLIKFV